MTTLPEIEAPHATDDLLRFANDLVHHPQYAELLAYLRGTAFRLFEAVDVTSDAGLKETKLLLSAVAQMDGRLKGLAADWKQRQKDGNG